MGAGAGGGSLNVGAMQKMQRQMAAKERMLAKMEEKRAATAAASQKHLERTSDPLRAVFRVDGDEPQEYSVLSAVEPPIPSSALNDAELVAMFADKPEKKKSSSGKKKSKK
jgi:hypothetical protein